MGRDHDHKVPRGVADANLLMGQGVNCSLSTNNVLNPATPYGDCSLIRIANLYANVLQVDRAAQLRECFDMLTQSSARLLNLKDYGLRVGNPADVVIIDAKTPEQAVAEIAQPVAVFKKGRQAAALTIFCGSGTSERRRLPTCPPAYRRSAAADWGCRSPPADRCIRPRSGRRS
jgi:cytosine deaminase